MMFFRGLSCFLIYVFAVAGVSYAKRGLRKTNVESNGCDQDDLTCLIFDHAERLKLDRMENPGIFGIKVDPNPVPNAKIRFPFASDLGRRVLVSNNTQLQDFFELSENFVTQDFQSFCGVASGTMILNALGNDVMDSVKPDPVYYPYTYVTQRMFYANRCVKKVLGLDCPLKPFMGMTLSQLADAILCYGENISVETYFFEDFAVANKTEIEAVKAMQNVMMEAMDDENSFVVANVNRPEVSELGGGHFSPIGAYHKIDSDSPDMLDEEVAKEHNGTTALFLFMDVARYKYEPMWVDGKSLMLAMKKQDSFTHKGRGFLVASRPKSRFVATSTHQGVKEGLTPASASLIQQPPKEYLHQVEV